MWNTQLIAWSSQYRVLTFPFTRIQKKIQEFSKKILVLENSSYTLIILKWPQFAFVKVAGL